ncbi:disease resistance protein Roq1-like [Cryptomeria japonica]|uniref:disease resistance protein Roq1-like n=1 Tax=Cryptomeria japonica TaxID=3369 RepID=UPI0027DA720D|nr:disease resistance protein Roq1-like [Cryptomeria japonica]
MVSRSLPEDIISKLRVSFDALKVEQYKQIFLDISCFFIGVEKHSAITVWEESGWSGECSLQTLVNKCLVEVDEQNCLRMHDLLRDLGRDISKTSSPYRLWSPQQVTSIFEKQREGSVLIRGIIAYTDEFYKAFLELVRESGIRFRQNEGFKILDVENNYFTEELVSLSEGFVSVRWANFPHADLPLWFKLEKLRVLELFEASKLVELWSESAVVSIAEGTWLQPPVQLRVLRINHARSFLRFPRSIGFLKHLKKMYFDGQGAPIEGLPDEFCCLQSLERLELVGCDKLKSLPSKFGDLTNLQHLILRQCRGIEGLPEDFDCLESLKELVLSDCHKLKALPSKFGNLKNLQTLNLNKCSGTEGLPEEFGRLQSLEELTLSCHNLKSLPSKFGDLANLKDLKISFRRKHLCRFLALISFILVFPTCQKFISLRGLAKLQSLCVDDCEGLRKIEGLENCSSLEVLILDTRAEVPVIENINMMDMESLRLVEIVPECQRLSACGACLQTINTEKWPSGLMIGVKSVPSVEAIVNSTSSPALTLVDSFHRQKKKFYSARNENCWWYVFLTERPANAAAMICLVIDCHGEDFLKVTSVIDPNYDSGGFWREREYGVMYVGVEKWVCIGVFTASSLVGSQVSSSLQDPLDLDETMVEMGILVMGEESKVVDAFLRLVQDLGKA